MSSWPWSCRRLRVSIVLLRKSQDREGRMQPNTAQASPRGPPVYVQATCVPCRRRGRLRSQDRSRRCRPWWGWRPPTGRRPFELSRSRRLRTGSVYVATLHLRRAAAGNWTRGRRGTKLLRSDPLSSSTAPQLQHNGTLGDAWLTLARALALQPHPPPLWVRRSPKIMAVVHAHEHDGLTS